LSAPDEGYSSLLTLSIPDEGYSSLLTLSVHDEGYSSILTLSVHDEGYSGLLTLSVHDEETHEKASSKRCFLNQIGNSVSMNMSFFNKSTKIDTDENWRNNRNYIYVINIMADY
jgi:hypothetical protein